jgi:hypothetical protein
MHKHVGMVTLALHIAAILSVSSLPAQTKPAPVVEAGIGTAIVANGYRFASRIGVSRSVAYPLAIGAHITHWTADGSYINGMVDLGLATRRGRLQLSIGAALGGLCKSDLDSCGLSSGISGRVLFFFGNHLALEFISEGTRRGKATTEQAILGVAIGP